MDSEKTIYNLEIIPGVGFDRIKFGMSRQQVIDILGVPDEICEDENYSGDPKETEELTTIFYYDFLGVSFSFEKMENYRLMEMAFENPLFFLGEIHVGDTKDKVFSDAEDLDLDDPEEEFMDEEENSDNVQAYTFYDKNVTVCFEDNILTTIQLGPFWSDDDTVDWPK